MTAIFKKGDRVKHEARTDWGLGEVLDDQTEDRVRVVFEDVGLKDFVPKYAAFVKVDGDEAKSEYLTRFVKRARKQGGRPGKVQEQFVPFAQAVEIFLRVFPHGFHDSAYVAGPRNEREYKLEAHRLAVTLLSLDELQKLLETGGYDEVCRRARQVVQKTNLIHHYEQLWLANALSTEGRRMLFAKELDHVLYGSEDLQARFESFIRMLYDIGAAKWTIATYLLFIVFPEKHLFIKPEVTKHAARTLGFDLAYTPELKWTTYDRALQFAKALRQKLSEQGKVELVPRDMIDLQSFIFVTGMTEFSSQKDPVSRTAGVQVMN